MGDYTLPPSQTLIAGMHGSGKSTFAFTYLVNADCACRFVFDDLGRAATRLGLRPQYTAAELEAALATKWVIYNPNRMFDDTKVAFDFFCTWVFECAKRGPGKKLLLVDEIWQWQNNHAIPKPLQKIVQAGREENLELVSCTQTPHKINASLSGQATELVCFRLQEPLSLDCVRDLGADVDLVRELPLGSFVSWNVVCRSRLSGKMF